MEKEEENLIIPIDPGPSASCSTITVPATVIPKRKISKKVEPPKWLSSTKPETSNYVPQIGDVIVYFKQGHVDLLQTIPHRNQFESTLDSLKDIFLGKVLSIEYFSGLEVWCKIKVAVSAEIIEEYTQVSWPEMETVDIVITDFDGYPDFLIFADYYFSSLKTEHSVGETCIGRFSDGDHEITIKKVQTDVMWNKYMVEFKSNGDCDAESFSMNPWEIKKIDKDWINLSELSPKGFKYLF